MGAAVGVWTARDAAWPEATLAVPSSQNAADPRGTLKQSTQPHSSLGRLLVPPRCPALLQRAGENRESGCSHRAPGFYRGARHSGAASKR